MSGKSIQPAERTAYHALMNFEIYNSPPNAAELIAMIEARNKLTARVCGRSKQEQNLLKRYNEALRKIDEKADA